MDKLRDFLISIGLGKNETEIYIALLELGDSSVLEISKKTHIHRSNIYDSLRNLIQRGLVYELDQPTKLFSAKSPNSLVDYMKHKEMELKEVVKDYSSRKVKKSEESASRISKGLFSARQAIYSLLETGEPILVYGIPDIAPEIIGPSLKDFHKKRMQKGIIMKQIYNSTAVPRIKLLNRMKFTEARALPSKYDSVASTNISGDKVIIILWQDEIRVVEIQDKYIAKTYKKYFDILWKEARKVV